MIERAQRAAGRGRAARRSKRACARTSDEPMAWTKEEEPSRCVHGVLDLQGDGVVIEAELELVECVE